jgi:hypothetical protein
MIACASQNSRLILLKYLAVLAVLALLFGVAKIIYIFRARAMRALAARWRFQYLGPSAPKWRTPSHLKVRPFSTASLSLDWYPASEIRQIWNVVEGQQNGVSVLIFDSIFGEGRGTYCTLIAYQTERNPFGIDPASERIASDRVVQSGGWTILYRIPPFVQNPLAAWTMGIRHLEKHLQKLGVGTVG